MSVELVTTKDHELRTDTPERTLTSMNESQETSEMLLYEELSRARIRDLEEDIRLQRARGSARAARRWARVARWAARRAERYQEQS